MHRLLALLLLLAAHPCFGQSPRNGAPVTGRFYIDVDDGARIFINGKMVYAAGINTSISPEIALQPGDRIVAQLFDTGGGKWLKLVFVAGDQKSAISFQRTNFKIISDPTVVDFTPADWAKWTKFAKTGTKNRDRLPVKNSADEVWGEGETTAVGAIVQAEMFRPYVAPGGAQALVGAVQELMAIEGFVDGPSTLHIRKDGIYWENGQNAKPGLMKEPTYVNGKEWMPKWTNAAQERGSIARISSPSRWRLSMSAWNWFRM
jgi:hypothetical protein